MQKLDLIEVVRTDRGLILEVWSILLLFRLSPTVTARNSFVLLWMHERTESIGSVNVWSTLDCSFGYWKLPIKQLDRHKTAFLSHHGLCQFTRMLHCLPNAPELLQSAIDIILSSVWFKHVMFYIDDIIIFWKKVEDQLDNLESFLSLLQNFGPKIKTEKCFFFHE